MANFTAGTSFTDGVTNDVTAAKLNALVADAVPTANLSLNSTTGTVSNFTTSTATINGPITASTSVINVGSGQIYKDSSGNVGIGTASPTANLHVVRSISQTDIDNATQAVSIVNTASDTSGNLTGIRLRQDNGTNVAQGYIGLSSTGNSATRANLIIATPNTSGNSTERLRIDSSGNVGVGNTTPSSFYSGANNFVIGSGSGEEGATIYGGNASASYLAFADGTTGDQAYRGSVKYDHSVDAMSLQTGAAERLRIDSSGNLLVGTTSINGALVGARINTNGKGTFTSNADAPVYVNRLTSDGDLVELCQDSIMEGKISVSGTTVSYNGGHLSRFSQLPTGQRDESIKKGTVLSNLDAMCEWRDAEGNLLPNEQLNKVKVSDVEGDSNVAGVFVNWDNDDQDNPFDLNMAMTGDMIIRIAQGIAVNRGDLLMSAGDGTAKPQGDDIRKSKTIAKVTSTNVTCTYEDGSYCVPCVLMAC